jgi:hypothetical protein
MQLRKLWRMKQELSSVKLSQQVILSVPHNFNSPLRVCPYSMTSAPELLAGDPTQTFQFLNAVHNHDATLNETFFTVNVSFSLIMTVFRTRTQIHLQFNTPIESVSKRTRL